jgi:hypothetical protein
MRAKEWIVNVESIHPSTLWRVSSGARDQGKQGVSRPGLQEFVPKTPADTKTDEILPKRPSPSAPEDGEKGVLRLLMEGHFRGVSDVRLRINFHERLGAMEVESVKTQAAQAVDSLVESVDQRIEAFVTSEDLGDDQVAAIAEAQSGFHAAVDDLVESFMSTEGVSQDLLVSGLSSALSALVESIGQLLVDSFGVAEGGGSDGVVDPSSPAESVEGLQALIDEINTSVGESIQGITDALSSARLLPAISEPNGNGAAYDKFLAMYQDMLLAGTRTTSHHMAHIDRIV